MLQMKSEEELIYILEPTVLYLFEWWGNSLIVHGRYLPLDWKEIVHIEAVPDVGKDVISLRVKFYLND